MKTIITTIAILISFNLMCQQEPDYYLNSKKVDLNKFYISSENIDSVFVRKDNPNGAIYIYVKNENFLTVEELLEKYDSGIKIDGSFLLMINNEPVDDLSGIRIDSSYFIYIELNKLLQVAYLDKKYRELKILNIYLEDEKRSEEIRIRGQLSKIYRSNNSPVQD